MRLGRFIGFTRCGVFGGKPGEIIPIGVVFGGMGGTKIPALGAVGGLGRRAIAGIAAAVAVTQPNFGRSGAAAIGPPARKPPVIGAAGTGHRLDSVAVVSA